MLCGSSCVKYVIENITKKEAKIMPDLFWATDLAYTLMKKIGNIETRCFNSRLYIDYQKNCKDKSFSGFKSIEKYLNNGGVIKEKRLTKETLIKEITESQYMIICVESRLLNNDDNMDGGHFIIIKKAKENVIMINPLKTDYEIKIVTHQYIINLCKDYGSWRILIR